MLRIIQEKKNLMSWRTCNWFFDQLSWRYVYIIQTDAFQTVQISRDSCNFVREKLFKYVREWEWRADGSF